MNVCSEKLLKINLTIVSFSGLPEKMCSQMALWMHFSIARTSSHANNNKNNHKKASCNSTCPPLICWSALKTKNYELIMHETVRPFLQFVHILMCFFIRVVVVSPSTIFARHSSETWNHTRFSGTVVGWKPPPRNPCNRGQMIMICLFCAESFP